MKKYKLLFAMFLTLIVTAIAIHSSSQTTVQVQSEDVLLNDFFNITVGVINGIDVYAAQFDLIYDSDMLEFVEYSQGNFLSKDGQNTFFQVNQELGKITYMETRMGNIAGVNGVGSLLTVTFKAKKKGTALLNLENQKLVDSNTDLIPIETTNGTVTIKVDADSDSYTDDVDCNDNNANIYPGATETCNNIDDDCDNNIDESLTQSCGSDVGECVSGTQTCSAGSWSSCSGSYIGPSTEICDGKDNDCDGNIDEGCNCVNGDTQQQSCGTGACSGGIQTRTCSNGNWGSWSSCSTSNKATTETCNNVDDDCDGSVDESLTQSCGSDTGECVSGTQTCNSGSWGSCSDVKPTTEILDGKDNDCDGLVDEICGNGNCEPELGEDQYYCWQDCAFIPRCGDGVCNYLENHDNCPEDCHMGCTPIKEICDHVDNDCDGTIDEGC